MMLELPVYMDNHATTRTDPRVLDVMRPYFSKRYGNAASAHRFGQDAAEAVDVARDAVQIHGGYGYIEEFPVCRHFRDSKILEIGEGTSEVMRILIARELGLPE